MRALRSCETCEWCPQSTSEACTYKEVNVLDWDGVRVCERPRQQFLRGLDYVSFIKAWLKIQQSTHKKERHENFIRVLQTHKQRD